ncbi:SDR family oxidoreductase [Candidatus Parcubacteria bacterium]|nr:SDR family oxidoreductase [Candidatus Parcubacteria bacterium]
MTEKKKVVVLTGASQGIGAHTLEHLCESGIRVYACAKAKINFNSPLAHTTELDIGNKKEVNEWIETITQREDRIDMLINNAGILGERKKFQEIEYATWEEVVHTNILGTILITRAVVPLLLKSQSSTILNISSIIGKFGRAGWSTYAVSKFAIEGLTQTIAQELCGSGVRVVSLLPSRITTKLREKAYNDKIPDSDLNKNQLLKSIFWFLNNPTVPITGVTLSCNDLHHWTADQNDYLIL